MATENVDALEEEEEEEAILRAKLSGSNDGSDRKSGTVQLGSILDSEFLFSGPLDGGPDREDSFVLVWSGFGITEGVGMKENRELLGALGVDFVSAENSTRLGAPGFFFDAARLVFPANGVDGAFVPESAAAVSRVERANNS